MTRSRVTTLAGGVVIVALLALVLLYLMGTQVRRITSTVSGSGCGIGTKMIDPSGSVRCVPPPHHPTAMP